ncbi:formylglycine-generating enzyme family protein [Providencia rettgeri]|uniref:formylglycine-generating enzyme family protein n=1 Tax=Providencia rettgeri TaxID=587 RepID=UPI0023608775|nr:SUMF1/EgtB/PvdO family nonheme iron enzyme [Providencia rettgeri]
MRLLNKIHCTILLAGLGLLTGCDQQLTAEQESQKQQLINQSLNNMVFIEGGSFMMGDFGGHDGRSTRSYTFEKDNKAFHKVTLDSFSMAKYPVTWREFNLWIALTGQPPSKHYLRLKKNADSITFVKAIVQEQFMARTDWQSAKDYCQWLGQQTNLPIDLPTEAQWEYAARNRGQFVGFASADGTFTLYEQYETEPEVFGYTAVGTTPPNPLGLYDMARNGLNWINDWYAEDYYSVSPELNPQGPSSGEEKVARGSTGTAYHKNITVDRHSRPPIDENSTGLGFRCAVQSPTPVQPVAK